MLNLKETLESFSLSEDTRRKNLNENHPFGNQKCQNSNGENSDGENSDGDKFDEKHSTPFIPSEFKEIAQITLAGHFLVNTGTQQVTVHPTCVEFYYHEEAEGGIKDPIVYHRNPKNGSPKSIFKLGILHNHVSGIDITFEKGTHPEDAIRASLLIREFSVDGNPPDSRSTLLYDMLYSQASIFDGFSIKWVDGEEKAEVEADVRKNVAKYDENGQKMQAKDHQELLSQGFTLTKDKKHIQDPRPWQFKKKKLC